MTQEKKYCMSQANTKGLEDFRRWAKSLSSTNPIQNAWVEDLLDELNGSNEKEFNEARNETGIFYFWKEGHE